LNRLNNPIKVEQAEQLLEQEEALDPDDGGVEA